MKKDGDAKISDAAKEDYTKVVFQPNLQCKLKPNELHEAERKGIYDMFSLKASVNTSNMVLFDAAGCLRKFDSPEEIHIENKRKAAIVEQLQKHDFRPDPVKRLKDEQKRKELEQCGEANVSDDEEEFITPIVKATKGKEEKCFYSIPEYVEWRKNTDSWKNWKIKYYKGLGTSTSKEAKEYFLNMLRHRIPFRYKDDTDDGAIELVFSKKKIEEHKVWLTNWMEDRKQRREQGEHDLYLYNKDTRSSTFSEFINKELVLFSNTDNEHEKWFANPKAEIPKGRNRQRKPQPKGKRRRKKRSQKRRK